MTHSLADELKAAVEATVAAGDEVARLRRDGLRYGHKEGRELVSEADIRAAEMLHEALTHAFPDTGWLSEEHVDTADRLDRERVWVVDPIDGTREYLMGLPEYAVSVALVIDGAPALGVVYNPATRHLAQAVSTESCEHQAQAVPADYDVLVGRGEQRWNDVPSLPGRARVKGIGSIAYRLALVAAGQGDAVVTGSGRAEWDVAAGAALCLAAGLRVTDVLGEPMRFNQPEPYVRGLLVARAGLHRRIRGHFESLR
jgi:myo-inositol-1(or 4)-monophosphatase